MLPRGAGPRPSSGGRRRARIGRSDAVDVLPDEQHRVGERHRIGHHETGRHQHHPAARASWCNERSSTHASGNPTSTASAPSTQPLVEARSSGPVTMPAPDQPMHRDRDRIPRNSTGGTLSGNRSSSPYASALRARAREAGKRNERERDRRHGERDRQSRRSRRRSPARQHRERTGDEARAECPCARREAQWLWREHGRRAPLPTAPRARPRRRCAWRGSPVGASASAAAGPAVSGSETHATRSSQMSTSSCPPGSFEMRSSSRDGSCDLVRLPLSRSRATRSYTTNLMPSSPHADVLVPGLATGIGSLPLEDPHATPRRSRCACTAPAGHAPAARSS